MKFKKSWVTQFTFEIHKFITPPILPKIVGTYFEIKFIKVWDLLILF